MIKVTNLQDSSTTATPNGSQTTKGQSYLLKQPIQDTVEFGSENNGEKKKKHSVLKWALGIGAAAAAVVIFVKTRKKPNLNELKNAETKLGTEVEGSAPKINESGSTPNNSGSDVNLPPAEGNLGDATVPGSSKPAASEPKTAEPESTAPKASETKTAEPETLAPKASEPKAAKPKTAGPKTTIKKSPKPRGIDNANIPSEERPLSIYEKVIHEEPAVQEVKPPVVETPSENVIKKIDNADIPSEERPLSIYEKPIQEEPVVQEVKPTVVSPSEKVAKLNEKLAAITKKRDQAQIEYDHVKEYRETQQLETKVAKDALDKLERHVSHIKAKIEEITNPAIKEKPVAKIKTDSGEAKKGFLTRIGETVEKTINTTGAKIQNARTNAEISKIKQLESKIQDLMAQKVKIKKDDKRIEGLYATQSGRMKRNKKELAQVEKRIVEVQGELLEKAARLQVETPTI